MGYLDIRQASIMSEALPLSNLDTIFLKEVYMENKSFNQFQTRGCVCTCSCDQFNIRLANIYRYIHDDLIL